MRRWPFPALFGAALLAGGCDRLDTGEQVGSICAPGEEVFCRCQNGETGTRVCGDEGGGFDSCSCEDGPGDPGAGGGGGGAGTGGGSSAAPIGSPCSADSQCESGLCAMGYCTLECAARSECPEGSACVRFEGSMQACLPGCGAVDDCDRFGPASTCGWAAAVDGSPATVCADWTDPALPPLGSPCEDHVDCQLGHYGTERACGYDGTCAAGCVLGSDCPVGSTCEGAGSTLGTCN